MCVYVYIYIYKPRKPRSKETIKGQEVRMQRSQASVKAHKSRVKSPKLARQEAKRQETVNAESPTTQTKKEHAQKINYINRIIPPPYTNSAYFRVYSLQCAPDLGYLESSLNPKPESLNPNP